MSDENSNILVRGMKRFIQVFNPPNVPSSDIVETKRQAIPLGQFSNDELEPAFKSSTSGNNSRNAGKDMKRYFEDASRESKAKTEELARLTTMAPEIKRAKDILVASIISPNDMQENSVSVTIDVPELNTSTVQSTINKYLTDLFNDDLEFGVKLSEYIGECLYGSGAKALMVVPKYNIGTLSTASRLQEQAEAGLERWADLEGLQSAHPTDFNQAALAIDTEIKADMATDILDTINKDPEFKHVKSTDLSKFIKTSIEGTVSKFSAKQHEHKFITISDNPNLINVGKRNQDKAMGEMAERVNSQFKKLHKDNLFVLSTEFSGNDSDMAAIVELPTESVIPVTVPGYEKEHLGYFVLVDRDGTAIAPTKDSTSQKLTKQTAKTFYGSNATGDMNDKQRYHVAANVFNMTIKNLIESKLGEYGLQGLTISRYNAIAASMFDHFIKKTKVGLIFVPEPLMVYYRFDHRKNGTGKSLLEDAAFLLSLRTTTLVARVMAASKDSIDKRVVEVGISDQDKDPEALMDMIANMFVKKRMPTFSNDPMEIAERLTRNALTIQQKGLDDFKESFTVSTDQKTSNAVRPDTELFETLTDMLIDFLIVPHDALNHTKETEYSRSIATNNLFFSNTLRGFQRIVQQFNNKFARTYLLYSKTIQDQLKDLISSSTDDAAKDTNVEKLMIAAIQSVSINLASPAISTNKAQYEEVDNFMSMIESVVDKLLPDEFITGENRDLQELMPTMRAAVKAQAIRKFLDSIGFQGTIDVPLLEDVDTDMLEKMQQLMLNVQRMLNDQAKVLGNSDM